MELSKKKETIWEIKRKNEKGSFKLRSVEEGDKITLIGIGLSKDQDDIFFEMTSTEFENFYSIIKSFKGLLNSKGVEFKDEEDMVKENYPEANNDVSNLIDPADEEEKKIEHKKLTEEIKSTTMQELENLKQFERAQKELADFSKPISYNDENNKIKPVESDSEDKFDPNEIFADLDNIEPSIEKGTNLYEEYSSDKKISPEISVGPDIIKKKNSDNEEEQLDPRDWDPW